MKILAITRVYGNGRTQIPREVKRLLSLSDGDQILWYKIEDKIYVTKA